MMFTLFPNKFAWFFEDRYGTYLQIVLRGLVYLFIVSNLREMNFTCVFLDRAWEDPEFTSGGVRRWYSGA